ncbi:MAG: nucleotidyltransferase domain-containing protein [Gammaproteobacteria bacterium]|nr:nucleotidyltransferase domain-containing protein [Gammaproteobacteria bacterium]
MSFGLDCTTINLIHLVFKKYREVSQVLIYGSRAKGGFRRGSDIDLVVLGEGLTESLLAAIRFDLDDLNTPYLFDISLFENLDSPSLQEHIARVGKVFYANDSLSSCVSKSNFNAE